MSTDDHKTGIAKRLRPSEFFALLTIGLVVLSVCQPLFMPDSAVFLLLALAGISIVGAFWFRRRERKRTGARGGSGFVLMVVVLILFGIVVFLPALPF